MVVASVTNSDSLPPALGTFSFPACGWSMALALDLTGRGPLPIVLDTSSTRQIVEETAMTEVTTFVDCALVTV
jgi:hypothetical protein